MDQLCTQADLGNFIIQSNGTSIYTKRVDLGTGANVADIKVVRSYDPKTTLKMLRLYLADIQCDKDRLLLRRCE